MKGEKGRGRRMFTECPVQGSVLPDGLSFGLTESDDLEAISGFPLPGIEAVLGKMELSVGVLFDDPLQTSSCIHTEGHSGKDQMVRGRRPGIQPCPCCWTWAIHPPLGPCLPLC